MEFQYTPLLIFSNKYENKVTLLKTLQVYN